MSAGREAAKAVIAAVKLAEVLKTWAEFYSGEDTALDNVVHEWHARKPEDWPSRPSGPVGSTH